MQSLNHHHLYIFWTFSKTGSFTKTAESLRIAQSAVTTQIKSLEETLNLTLVDRTVLRRPELTESGKRVANFAETIFATSRELMDWALKNITPEKQVLRVGALSGLSRNLQFEFLEPILGKQNTQVEVTTGDQKKLVELLIAHELDVVLSSHNVAEFGSKVLQTHVLTSSQVVFVASTKKRLKTGKDQQDPFAPFDLFTPGRNFEAKPELDAYLHKNHPHTRIAGEIDDIALLRIIALRTNAIVALPEMGVRNDLLAGELNILGMAKGVRQRFYAITRERRSAQHEIFSLIDELKRKSLHRLATS